MKLVLLCLLFAPILFFAFKQKKWYLYLMVAFTSFLPEQLSVSLHDSLPLLSASRMLILLVAAFWLYERIKTHQLKIPTSLLIFFGINIALALFHLFFDLDELNHIAILLMERALVVIMLADMIKSRREFELTVDFAILGCCAVSVMGLCQTVFDYDIASVLHLTETMSSTTLPQRMGLTRAFGTFNAISLGCYLSMMLLPIYYRLEKTRLHRYSAAFALTFTTLVCTFTRSAWLCAAGIFFLLLLLRRMKMIKRLLPAAGMTILLCLVLCLPQPKLATAFAETGKSAINTILMAIPSPSDKDTASIPSSNISSAVSDPSNTSSSETSSDVSSNEEEPEKEPNKLPLELNENFGNNATDPTYTRVVQWSAVKYMMSEGKLLLGYGYNAYPEGKLHYLFDRWTTLWLVADTLDVGLVAIFTEIGLIGFLTHIGLLCFLFLYALCHKKKGVFDFYSMFLYVIPLYLLLNYLASFPYAGILWVLLGLFYAYSRLEKTLPPEEIPALPQKKWKF